MNQLQIFKNEEFGEVRSLLINNEPCFVGKDVALILGYSNPQKAIRDHIDEDDKRTERIVHPQGGTQDTVIINESGLYSLILSSKLPTAKKFKRWVTNEVLPSIRKYGVYQVSDDPMIALKLMFEATEQTNDRVKVIDSRVTNLENTTTVDSRKQYTLRKIASATAVRVLGGKDSQAYLELHHKVFCQLWRDYKDYFKIPSYRDTLKIDFEKAKEYLQGWRPDHNLQIEISSVNEGHSMDCILVSITISVTISYLITHLLLVRHLLDIEDKFRKTCDFTINEINKLKKG